MDKPLTIWYCDMCGEPVSKEDGYVLWSGTGNSHIDFHIIHQGVCDDDRHHRSMPLTNFLGKKGLVYLTKFLSLGMIIKHRYPDTQDSNTHVDLDEYVDFFRRVQLPYYEEARKYFSNSELQEDYYDSNEVFPYLPDRLKHIIDTYQNK